MIVSKSCLFYRDSRCFLKGRICDLSCGPMGLYDPDDGESSVEEKEGPWSGREDIVWFERLQTVSEEEEDDDL